MKALILFVILSVLSMCACCSNTNNEQHTEFIVAGGTESMFSTSLLSGTSWIADFSDDKYMYKMSFTDTTHIVEITYTASKRTYVENFSYYLSNVKPQQFDWTKVGKETRGDVIVLYDKTSKDGKLTADKLFFISPQKLILLLNEVDTITFTRE